MKTFKDLKFKKHPNILGGIQATMFFGNGYGISVVKGSGTYGYERGLYEIAVLIGHKESYSLCYTSEITDDVLGNQTIEDIDSVMNQIQSLHTSK